MVAIKRRDTVRIKPQYLQNYRVQPVDGSTFHMHTLGTVMDIDEHYQTAEVEFKVRATVKLDLLEKL